MALDNYEIGNPIDSTERLVSLMWDRLLGHSLDPATVPEFGDLLVRFNQGWIVARVMDQVPSKQPYASGATLLDAAVFSIVPRPLFPGKREGASQALFTKYTGSFDPVISDGERIYLTGTTGLYALAPR